MRKITKWLLSENTAVVFLMTAVVFLIGLALCYIFLVCTPQEGLGGLTGGIVACIIAVANTILLYLTLKSQNESVRNQKDIARQERFETTLFNLLEMYFGQLQRISFDAFMLQDPPHVERITVNGSSFIEFAFGQLCYLKAYFESDHYIGSYDASSDLEGYDYKTNPKEELNYDEHLRIKYMANVYGISEQQFKALKKRIDSRESNSQQICYQLFYSRWGRSYDHYIRTVKVILKFIKSRVSIVPETDYMATFKALMSSKEQRFLNYHASIDKAFAEALQGTIIMEDFNKQHKPY